MDMLTAPESDRTVSDVGPLLLTPDESAKLLRVSRAQLYKWLATGELKSIKLGRSRRVPMAALREWVDQQINSNAA